MAACEGDRDPSKPDCSDPERSMNDRLQAFLDTPLIDPTRDGGKSEPQLLRNFKALFKSDYQMAETLYAGGVFAVLLFFSQQAVRIYKHCYFMPDNTCPWDVVSPSMDIFNF